MTLGTYEIPKKVVWSNFFLFLFLSCGLHFYFLFPMLSNRNYHNIRSLTDTNEISFMVFLKFKLWENQNGCPFLFEMSKQIIYAKNFCHDMFIQLLVYFRKASVGAKKTNFVNIKFAMFINLKN